MGGSQEPLPGPGQSPPIRAALDQILGWDDDRLFRFFQALRDARPAGPVADALIALADDLHRRDAPPKPPGPLLIVLILRTLAAVHPRGAVGPPCRLLARLGDVELTASLDALSAAVTALPAGVRPGPELVDVTRDLWRRYCAACPPTVNRPGILSRLIELSAQCGEPIDAWLDEAERHAPQAIYLLSHRPLQHLDEAQKDRCYRRAIRVLRDRGQSQCLGMLSERLGPEKMAALQESPAT